MALKIGAALVFLLALLFVCAVGYTIMLEPL